MTNNPVFNFDAENYLICFIFYVLILLSIILSLTGMCIDMYVQLWYIGFIIISWYWSVTVFGFLPVILSQIFPHGNAPNIIFFVNPTLTFLQKKCGVVVIWKISTKDFLYMKDTSAVSKDQKCTWNSLLTALLPSTTDDLLQISLSSLMFGDNIYVGYVLKVPPVSYFLYIK